MLLVVALYLGNEVVDGLSESDNISQMTHIVGGLCGIVFGFSLARAKEMIPIKRCGSHMTSASFYACLWSLRYSVGSMENAFLNSEVNLLWLS